MVFLAMFLLIIAFRSGASLIEQATSWDEACYQADRFLRSQATDYVRIVNRQDQATTEIRRRAA